MDRENEREKDRDGECKIERYSERLRVRETALLLSQKLFCSLDDGTMETVE